MAEELDWGPTRPPAVGWAGVLLLLLALAQLGALGAAVGLEADAFLTDDAGLVVTGAVAGLLALQLLAAIGVLRLWRWWRGIAMLLCLLGLALHGVTLAGPADPPPVVAVSAVAAGLYVLVIALLARSRSAFA